MKVSDIGQNKNNPFGKRVITVESGDRLADALGKMRQHSVHHLVVVQGTRVVGLLSARELCHALQQSTALAPDTPVGSVMTENPPLLTEKEELGAALRMMRDRKVTGLPVVMGGELKGIITETDAILVLEQLLSAKPADTSLTTEFQSVMANPVMQNIMKLLGDAGI